MGLANLLGFSRWWRGPDNAMARHTILGTGLSVGRAGAIKIHSFIHEKEHLKIYDTYGLSDVEKHFNENICKENKGYWGRSRGSNLIGEFREGLTYQ